MTFPDAVLLECLRRTYAEIESNSRASLHGVMFDVTRQMGQGEEGKASELYSQARELMDQTDKLRSLDAAIGRLTNGR